MTTGLPTPSPAAQAHSDRVCELIRADIDVQGGWIPFSRFMELALYAPSLGYYSAGARKFGPDGDFVTAPEISSLFGRSLARQVADIMEQSSPQVLELGAGSGKLAADVLTELERMQSLPHSYSILEVSPDLRARQQILLQERVPHLLHLVHWLDMLPDTLNGALIANEVLDALPVHLLYWKQGKISERGVEFGTRHFVWQDRLPQDTSLQQAAQRISTPADYLSEISFTVRGLVSSLCERLQQGALLFVDYGFGASEYYHPQRNRGTLMCHYRHHAHDDPFFLPGLQDITAHVDFSAVAESAIASGAHLLGYTSQAHFLINCGIADFLAEADPENVRNYLPLSSQLQKLTSPAEMGELFKVIAVGKDIETHLRGFTSGDKSRLL